MSEFTSPDSHVRDPYRRIRRQSPLPLTMRIGVAVLLMALTAWILLPIKPPPEALTAAARYLEAEYSRYEVVPAARATRFLGTITLTYATSHEGASAKIVVFVVRSGGELVVRDARLMIGEVTGNRIATFLIPLIGTWALICLVLLWAVPRTFGRKCPRDQSLLAVDDRVAVPEQHHASGVAFEPIIERVYRCRKCDFRHYEAFPDPTHRQTVPLGRLVTSITWTPAHIPWRRDIDELAEESDARRMAGAITKEQYDRLLREAMEAARARSSRDSPWLYRS